MNKEITHLYVFDEIKSKFTLDEKLHIGVVYHIFPDSFYRSNGVTPPGDITFIPWNSLPASDTFYGGNIKGIREKLDYIKELGISYIYLTPLFRAKSNHRYDCSTYNEIDPILGTPEDFSEFVKECHKNDIKVILDIVLNHSGIHFWAFEDLLKNQEKSKYKDWFIIKKFPIKYEPFKPNYSCWWNFGDMPQFNLGNPEVRSYLFESCADWIRKYNIDGWRIDVAPELGFDFLREFREYMKGTKEDVLIIGENWKDSRKFLEGDQLNGITNYLIWWKAFEPFFVRKSCSVSGFMNNLMLCYFLYPHARSLENWNVLSSHDVARFSTTLNDKSSLYNAVFMQIFIPGNPVIYYGDEIGLEGNDTPDNRRSMDWNRVNSNKLLDWYKKLIAIRNNEEIIKKGHLKVAYISDEQGILIFSRYLDNKQIYFLVNFSDVNREIDLDENVGNYIFNDILNKEDKLSGKITLEANQAVILKPIEA